jgi:hypothetical protein
VEVLPVCLAPVSTTTGPRLRGALQTGFNRACNPHMQNIRYNRILCTTFVSLGLDVLVPANLSDSFLNQLEGAVVRLFLATCEQKNSGRLLNLFAAQDPPCLSAGHQHVLQPLHTTAGCETNV